MTVDELLKYGEKQLKKTFVNPYDESLYILADILNCSLVYPLTILNKELLIDVQNIFKKRITKRVENIPRQYLSNRQDFLNLELSVGKGVLIPRPETEELVEIVVKTLNNKHGIILEPCTGTAAIALSLAEKLNCHIIASDISKEALLWAKKNLDKYISLKNKISLIRADLLTSFKFFKDIIAIVINPPYIPTQIINTLEKQVQDHEPFIALDGGTDGLEIINKLIIQSKEILPEESYLFLEIGIDQDKIIKNILNKNNFKNIRLLRDFNNIKRFIICQKI